MTNHHINGASMTVNMQASKIAVYVADAPIGSNTGNRNITVDSTAKINPSTTRNSLHGLTMYQTLTRVAFITTSW